jgi:hypothetical protein
MATATYVPLATTTLGSATNIISFTSIPSSYTDLRVVLTGKDTTSAGTLQGYFNNDAASNYSYVSLYSSIVGPYTDNNTSAGPSIDNEYGLQSAYSNCLIWDIFSYANSSTYKSSLLTNATEINAGNTVAGMLSRAFTWRSTAAITSVYLKAPNNFAIGTTATLWGI